MVRRRQVDSKDSVNDTHVTHSFERPSEREKRPFRKTWASFMFSVLKYTILVLLIPPFLNYAALSGENDKIFPQGGVLYDIGFGQKIFMKCLGKGSPTVILDAPTGMSSDVWAIIHPRLAKLTKVCVYDRAGIGLSERPLSKTYNKTDNTEIIYNNRWKEFTLERMADDLNRLLTKSSQQIKPLILVGSELGALIARFYSHLYEGDVSNIILIDPLVEDIFNQDSGVWTKFWFGNLIPSYQALQFSAATGLSRLALLVKLMSQPISSEELPEETRNRQKHLLCQPRHMSSVVDEHYFINDSFSQINTMRKVKPYPSNTHVTVVTGNYYDEQLPSSLNQAWAKSQEFLISRLHPGSHHIVVNGADRKKIYETPKVVSEIIIKVIKKWRTNSKAVQS